MAKIINGEVELFHVKKASEVVETENQLSAMRSINAEFVKAENKIKKLVDSISSEYKINIGYDFSFGNLKEEISVQIKNVQPDLVIVGKRKTKPLSLIGDQITQHVLKQYKGAVLIAAAETALEPNTPISLGFLNDTNEHLNVDFADDLIAHSQQPLKSFKIIDSSKLQEKNSTPSHPKKIEYVFEQSDSVLKNLSRYLSKNNVDLLCINRENSDAINKLNVSLLVAK